MYKKKKKIPFEFLMFYSISSYLKRSRKELIRRIKLSTLGLLGKLKVCTRFVCCFCGDFISENLSKHIHQKTREGKVKTSYERSKSEYKRLN